MDLEALRASLPAYAKDLSLNLSSLAAETLLTDQQKWGCFVASAHAVGVPAVIKAVEATASESGLSETGITAAKATAAITAMNSVYDRAIHLMHNPEYRTLPARLRMDIVGNPGVDKADFALWSMAVSAINGCGACLDAHEAELKTHGLPNTAIQAALRIAAVVNAFAHVVASEEAVNG
jgi:alkyl hydroperoxide reductase subunit D